MNSKQNMLFIPVALATLALVSPVDSQERQGNIVEYFGKEKVETISEGDLLHMFQQGLVLSGSGPGFATSSTPQDRVFARFLLQSDSGIIPGQTFDADFTGQPVKWETLDANKTNTFEDRRLRSGFLYLSYTSGSADTVLLDASGHTRLLINGKPHEGDHYDFGWSLIPVELKEGQNEFILRGGRFDRMRARLITPTAKVQFTLRDMTLPDVRKEDPEDLLGAVRVINARTEEFRGGSIVCRSGERSQETALPPISPMNVRKVRFTLPFPELLEEQAEQVEFELTLKDSDGNALASNTIELNVRSQHKHHKRTFVSEIDGSVQYYSVAPSSNPDIESPAMFLSVHGASVEATNQANAYTQKTWGHIVAPTNRRPFGFAWEDWGRLDALEVLADAERIYQTDVSRTYLTGHSMGGHGTWYLGATYPDRFAAIAPCAGYPDLLEYRGSFLKRMQTMPKDQLARMGVTDVMLDRMRSTNEKTTAIDDIVNRAGNPTRTLKLLNNCSQHGVYILHGEEDTVVPTEIARDMRRRLSEFHADFCYYEYPNGSHWYGDHSMDWKPIFDFFQDRKIKPAPELSNFSFRTASPGVSASSRFLTILQQQSPLEISSVEFAREEDFARVVTHNVHALSIDLAGMGIQSHEQLQIDGATIEMSDRSVALNLVRQEDKWTIANSMPSRKEKGPHRNGGFKDAFRHNMVFVYATQGTKQENEWYYNKARFDAEKFWYQANGNVELMADTQFAMADFPDRNVILYGNRDNNSAWKLLLEHCPLQVSSGILSMGETSLTGVGWGAYFIFPRCDSDVASVGVVTASGVQGMKAAYANQYLVNGTSFPDVLIFDEHLLTYGIQAVKCGGFWGNDWGLESGDFVWQ